MAKNKYDFIAEVLEKKTLNASQKERLYKLISKEIMEVETKDSEILKRVEEIEKKITNNAKKTSNRSDTSKSGNPPKGHNPQLTVKFLKNFKYQNDTGFKELVHKPNEEGLFDLKKTLEKVKKHPNLIWHFHKQESGDYKKHIAKTVHEATIELIELIEVQGVKFNEKTGKHPIEDRLIRETIQKFKRDYRFGEESSESSQLVDLIINVANKPIHEDEDIKYSFGDDDNSGLFNICQIEFNPSEEVFKLKASFFTWVPNIRNSLWWIFEGILKHSNHTGSRNFRLNDKKIQVSLERKRDQSEGHTEVVLKIRDEKSWMQKPPDTLFEELKGSNPFVFGLRNIADWRVECFHPEYNGLVFNMLSQKDPFWEKKDTVGEYFEHIITFYD